MLPYRLLLSCATILGILSYILRLKAPSSYMKGRVTYIRYTASFDMAISDDMVTLRFGPVAQLDRALACGAKGHKFRSALPVIAGALRRSLLAPALPALRSGGSRVHSPSPPPRSSTGRRVSMPAHDGYSSRSQPTSSVVGSLRGLCRNGQARPCCV